VITVLAQQAQDATSRGFDFIQTLALVLTAGGLVLAGLQIRRESRSANANRQADLSWNMYLSYTDPALRAARGKVEELAHSGQCPSDAAEYKTKIADDEPWKHFCDDTIDMHVRRLLRFYNQVGVLTRKGLIDQDFVFGLVGPGLDTCWPALSSAIGYYQSYYGGLGGTELANQPRPIYNEVSPLHKNFVDWSKCQSVR